MKLARMQTPDGIVSGQYEDGTLTADDGEYVRGRDGSLTYPCSLSALYCVGRNFTETLDQMDYDVPDNPDWFIKPAVSLHPQAQPIEYPDWTTELTYAGELVAVMDANPHIKDPHLEWDERIPVQRLKYDEHALARYGLTPAAVARSLQGQLHGEAIAELRQGIRTDPADESHLHSHTYQAKPGIGHGPTG